MDIIKYIVEVIESDGRSYHLGTYETLKEAKEHVNNLQYDESEILIYEAKVVAMAKTVKKLKWSE